jgi:putative ABC transport system ATP-binding protein
MIELHGVGKTYGVAATAVHALRDVSLCVAAGDFVAVTGPSGSGKSTLLQLVGGLDVPSTGRVAVDGCTLADLSDRDLTVFRRRRVGVVFQSFTLLPTHTAEENVALPLRYDGRPAGEVRERVAQSLDRVGLLPRRRHRPDQLSGGEQQRVAIARALVTEPALLLADEPTGNLDSASGAQVLALLADAHGARGCTVLLVTHDEQAAARAARTVTLRDGVVTSGA